jgi:hypothetical protein
MQYSTEINDPVFDWLNEQGYLTGQHTKEFYGVQCPWSDEHTQHTGPGQTGYSPLGYGKLRFHRTFHCLHSHNKKIHEFLDWVAKEGGPHVDAQDASAVLINEVVSITNGGCWGLLTPNLCGSESILNNDDELRRRYQISTKMLNSLKLNDELKTAHSIYYDPTKPKYYYDDKKKEYYFNTYSKPKHPHAEVDNNIFFEHLHTLFPDPADYEFMLDWCAVQVQQPGERVCSIILIDPRGGEGKGLFTMMLARVLGENNVGTTTIQNLSDIKWHNDFEGKTLLVINESRHFENKHEYYMVYEGIKEAVDDSPRRS